MLNKLMYSHSYNHHETISLRLKNNEKEAVVSITFVGDKNKEAPYGYIDLATCSVKTDVIWGFDNWELGEKYGQSLFDGLLSIEIRFQNQVGISLKDLGFVNF